MKNKDYTYQKSGHVINSLVVAVIFATISGWAGYTVSPLLISSWRWFWAVVTVASATLNLIVPWIWHGIFHQHVNIFSGRRIARSE